MLKYVRLASKIPRIRRKEEILVEDEEDARAVLQSH
jgi:hypothetical protein